MTATKGRKPARRAAVSVDPVPGYNFNGDTGSQESRKEREAVGNTPYWGKMCVLCGGYISDSLLECLAPGSYSSADGKTLGMERPGVALACPYCNGLIGF